jgi:hypothetical protein
MEPKRGDKKETTTSLLRRLVIAITKIMVKLPRYHAADNNQQNEQNQDCARASKNRTTAVTHSHSLPSSKK